MKFWLFRLHNYGVCRNLKLRHFGHATLYRNAESIEAKVDPRILALRDKLLYCDYLDSGKVKMGFLKRKKLEKLKFDYEKMQRYEEIAHKPAFSILLNDLTEGKNKIVFGQEEKKTEDNNSEKETVVKRKPVHMPYEMVDSYEIIDSRISDDTEETSSFQLNEEYKNLYEKYLEMKKSGLSELSFKDFIKSMEDDVDGSDTDDLPNAELRKVSDTWMSDYEQFDDTLLNVNCYGTSDPNSKISCVPCGGCGALLHCRDPAIPGYLPSELFSFKSDEDLKSMTCQRCHFLRFYNTALEVKVSIEDYPKLLRVIKSKKCAVILIIDLTDFPCSIWPDLKSILHPFTPIFLVGNKIDLLPTDSPSFLENVKQCLVDSVINVTGVKRENITHVQLTSAKTGYGIEHLINKLQYKWRHKGDVYLVGCTNVGKSSLFNTLLNSDYCKVQAIDLVQRATVSAWPGTTLNLLKFPILNPTDEKRWLRTVRLINERFYRTQESHYKNYQFKMTKDMKFATLEEHVGKSFTRKSLKDASVDPFSEKSYKVMSRKPVLDESRPEYKQSRWCYDTPGTIQADQILNLLTTDELSLTLPQEIITPRTFMFKPKQTVFVAGMGRLDYLEGEHFIRCTLFASKYLPITICCTADADEVYDRLLGTSAFLVPIDDSERLKVWPKLKPKEIREITGVDGEESVADVVLSSIGRLNWLDRDHALGKRKRVIKSVDTRRSWYILEMPGIVKEIGYRFLAGFKKSERHLESAMVGFAYPLRIHWESVGC
ncbi:nitric oxide-associated protein 1 isoform X1 [Bombus terrestris]|uniref:Nitric oxide-associated protein 1 isoform X1 n=1 Tax=Bombus terrestris TaxID=30195 RepID=A0A9C6SR48_BOMTE|nr:nitric oxide-associated protein 1 isoform X1 [Bombus terrestris]